MATWTINQMERTTADNGVVVVHWSCSATDGDFSGSVYGSQSFEYDATSPDFIAYESLTESIVLGWLKTSMGAETVAAHEAAVAAQIEAQKNPVQASGLPW